MEKSEKFQKEKIGNPEYVNENCWLAKNLGHSPSRRCQYCELKFRKCLFIHYLIISLVLILFVFALSFLLEGRISKLTIFSFFVLVLTYGYFFNTSTNKVIEAYFIQKKARESLEEWAGKLEEQVEQRTEELRKANAELKRLDEAKSEFVSIASHQLRTPLTTIKGLVSMALEDFWGPLNDDQRKYLGQVYLSGEKLLLLIEDLLDISRIEAGRMQFHFQIISLKKISEEVIRDLIPQAGKKGLTLRLAETGKKLPDVKADALKIRQVIQNLIDNAVKYTSAGEIVVHLQKENNFLVFSVVDSGIGVSKEDQDILFEKFQRGKGATSAHTEGTGLGLYLAAKIVAAHNGKIGVKSEGKNKGSTFFFSLPIAN